MRFRYSCCRLPSSAVVSPSTPVFNLHHKRPRPARHHGRHPRRPARPSGSRPATAALVAAAAALYYATYVLAVAFHFTSVSLTACEPNLLSCGPGARRRHLLSSSSVRPAVVDGPLSARVASVSTVVQADSSPWLSCGGCSTAAACSRARALRAPTSADWMSFCAEACSASLFREGVPCRLDLSAASWRATAAAAAANESMGEAGRRCCCAPRAPKDVGACTRPLCMVSWLFWLKPAAHTSHVKRFLTLEWTRTLWRVRS
ncbi:unnamed protein product [Chondrus crispus]|uniref:Uncharacterized protein n=1 Tax=Chondrus crispus TaxID=2769 RepID=R7QGR1_CHOCR|nr:unnamed protein product [Chondrus crispus]CDF36600.1 unnamed protein product [Chondrus crispus]|eukprot:XP_005716419.1 unnamed protein product [Chondrus crispus]